MSYRKRRRGRRNRKLIPGAISVVVVVAVLGAVSFALLPSDKTTDAEVASADQAQANGSAKKGRHYADTPWAGQDESEDRLMNVLANDQQTAMPTPDFGDTVR